MTTTTRQFLVGGNWKMNGTKGLVDTLCAKMNTMETATQVVVAPPAPYLALVREKLDSKYHVSAQNIHQEGSGAFTGEVSHTMLKDLGINWTILGHSERREKFGESDELIGTKTGAALKAGLSVIFCCGETLQQREANETTKVVFRQLEAIKGLNWENVVIAYEPVWAIGTGKVATPDQAQEVHLDIRKWLAENVSKQVSDATRILYGGSVNAGNCVELSKQADIDGFLVGGASLKEDFVTICKAKE